MVSCKSYYLIWYLFCVWYCFKCYKYILIFLIFIELLKGRYYSLQMRKFEMQRDGLIKINFTLYNKYMKELGYFQEVGFQSFKYYILVLERVRIFFI